MRQKTARIGLGVLAIAAAIVLFVVLQDSGDEGDTSAADRQPVSKPRTEPKNKRPKPPPLPVVVVEDGEPVGGVLTLEYRAGDRIRFKVRSDVVDEVHVHGYDLSKEVEAGGTVAFDFPATIEGVFEAELEQRGEHILELRVNP